MYQIDPIYISAKFSRQFPMMSFRFSAKREQNGTFKNITMFILTHTRSGGVNQSTHVLSLTKPAQHLEIEVSAKNHVLIYTENEFHVYWSQCEINDLNGMSQNITLAAYAEDYPRVLFGSYEENGVAHEHDCMSKGLQKFAFFENEANEMILCHSTWRHSVKLINITKQLKQAVANFHLQQAQTNAQREQWLEVGKEFANAETTLAGEYAFKHALMSYNNLGICIVGSQKICYTGRFKDDCSFSKVQTVNFANIDDSYMPVKQIALTRTTQPTALIMYHSAIHKTLLPVYINFVTSKVVKLAAISGVDSIISLHKVKNVLVLDFICPNGMKAQHDYILTRFNDAVCLAPVFRKNEIDTVLMAIEEISGLGIYFSYNEHKFRYVKKNPAYPDVIDTAHEEGRLQSPPSIHNISTSILS